MANRYDRSQRNFAFGKKPQVAANGLTAYQSPYPTPYATSAPLDFWRVISEDDNLAQIVPKTLDNKGFSTGSENATEQYLIRHEMSVAKSGLRVNSWLAGWIGLMGLGQITSALPGGAIAPTKRHTSTPMPKKTDMQLPAFPYVEDVGGAYNEIFPSCVVNQFTLKGNTSNFLALDLDLRGSGKRIQSAGINFEAPTQHVERQSGLVFWFNTQAALVITDNGTPINIACDYLTFELQVNNNLLVDAGYLDGCNRYQTDGVVTSGQIASEMMTGDRNYALKFSAFFKPGSHYLPALMDQRPLVWEMKYTGPTIQGAFNHDLTLKAALTQYEAVQRGFTSDGLLQVDVTPKVLESATGETISMVTTNNVALYV